MVLGDGFFVGGHDAVIAARQRAGPGFVRTKFFVVLKNLTRQREQGMQRFALRQAGSPEHSYPRFFQSKNQPGSERPRRVVERFFLGGNVYGDSAERSRDGTRDADGGGVTFDGEDFAFKRRNADTVESLHRVHRCSGSAELADSL